MSNKKTTPTKPSVLKSTHKKTKRPTSYRWIAWLIFFFSFALYANTISFDFALDDGMFITYNRFVREGLSSFPDLVSKGSLYGFNESNVAGYRPVVLVNLALELSIFGNDPKVFHFFNVFWYAILCAVLLNFLKRILKQAPIYIPVLITILFAVHPLHTEVVANIKSRDEILCMLFGILTVDLLYRYVDEQKKNTYVMLACLCFFLSALSKENGFTWLAIAPLVLYFFSATTLKRIALLTLPLIATAGLAILIRMMVLDSQVGVEHTTAFDNSLIVANNFSDRLATTLRIMLHALMLLLFPVNLSWDYSYNHFPIVTWSHPAVIASLVIHLSLLAIAIMGIKRKSVFSFAILFYFITYFITSNLVITLASSFGERFLFTPSLGFCIALPFLMLKLFKPDPNRKMSYANAILSFVAFLFAIKTVSRSLVWENNTTLLSSGLETAPNSARAHAAYAKIYVRKAEAAFDKNEKLNSAAIAIDELKKAAAIYPHDFDMYYNMGVVHFAIGDTTQALKDFRKALDLNPTYADALNNIGVIYTGNKNFKTALEYFLQMTKIRAKDSKAWGNAGACYHNLLDTKTALTYYEKALELDPRNRDVIGNIATLYEQTGDSLKARLYRGKLFN